MQQRLTTKGRGPTLQSSSSRRVSLTLWREWADALLVGVLAAQDGDLHTHSPPLRLVAVTWSHVGRVNMR